MQAGKGGVRMEGFQIGVEAEGEQAVVELLAQLEKVRMGVPDACPQDLRLPAWGERADSFEWEDDAGDADGGQRVLERGEARFGNFADEADGEVELGWSCPVDAVGDRSLQRCESRAEGVG